MPSVKMDEHYKSDLKTRATLVVNEAGIDKYTVHSVLNCTGPSIRVTDIYIQRKFVMENTANKRVAEYVFGEGSY